MRFGDLWRGWQWRRREGSRRVVDACHCGRPVTYGFDGNPAHHRPEDCPYRFTFDAT